MTAEDFLNQYDPSNKRSVSQEPASSASLFLDQYDPSINKNLDQEPSGVEPSGVLRQAADLPIQFAKGIGSGVRGFTDIIGADNPVSKSIAGYEDYMDSLLSAESKQDSKRVAQMLQEAKDGGFLDKISAGFEAFASAPLETTANVAGYMVPQLAIGLVGKAAQLGKAAQVGLTLGAGFAQGVGIAKGNIYQNTKEYLRERGVPEDQIEPIAVKAQSYNGGNLDQLLLSGGLNALAASTGAEAILTRVLAKEGKEVSGEAVAKILKGVGVNEKTAKSIAPVIAGGGKGIAAEAPIEGVQNAQEEVAKNIALQRLGYDVPTFQGAIESATTGIVAGGAIGGLAGGAEALSPEQKEQIDIEKEANRRARDLESTDPATQALSTEITRLERGIDNKRMDLDALESTSPEASKMRLDIAADQSKLVTLKEQANKLGLSETITEAERQQIELAKAITTPAAPAYQAAELALNEKKTNLAALQTQFDKLSAGPAETKTEAPVAASATPTATKEKLAGPQRTISDAIKDKDTFVFEGMRGAISLEDGTVILREFGTNNKYEVPVNPNQDISEISGIKWVRKGQTKNIAAEPTATEVSAIIESDLQISEEEVNAEQDDFQVPQSLVEIEKSQVLNYIAEVLNTGESKIVKDGKRKQKVSQTPEFYSQITSRQIELANRQIDTVLRIIDGLPISDEQKQSLAEPYLLIDQDITSYENNPEYKRIKDSKRREVFPTDQDVALAETGGQVEAAVSETITEGFDRKDIDFPAFDSLSDYQKKAYQEGKPITSGVAKGFIETEDNYWVDPAQLPAGAVMDDDFQGFAYPKGDGRVGYIFMDLDGVAREGIAPDELAARVKFPAKVSNDTTAATTPAVTETTQATPIETDPVRIQQIKNSIQEGNLILRTGKFNGKKLSPEKLAWVQKSVTSSLAKLGEAPTVTEAPTAEPAGKPKIGERGGILIPSREDFIQAGRNIYEAGMEFGAWAKQMIQQFGDVVREFLGDVWQAVSGMPAKLNELMGYLPKKGEAGAVNIGGGKKQPANKPTPEQPTPTPEKPTESVTEVPSGERQQIMGEKIGPLKKTPEGIIAETQAKLRERFDPTKVTEQNTTEAFRALGRLTGKDGTAFAQELNDIGRMVDESGAAAEVSMGAALFVNDLFEYAVRLAAQGDKKMLGIMMTNINRLPTGTEGRTGAGQALRAAREMKDTFLTMARAEQDAFINYAAEFVYGPNPTKEQVDSIKIGYDAVEKVQEPTAKEVEEEIAAVGEKTGTDLVGRINEEFTKATEKGKEKRKTEIDELDSEYKKIQEQADKEIEKLAKIQSDTPSFDPAAARQTANDVRAIVANDLKQRPDMGRKAPWKSLLVAKLQEAGVEVAAAETLADIVWRQHEINSLSRELSSIDKAIEKGPISEIVKAIKDTPLEDQQNPNWRYEVMRDYLRRAGLNVAQAERIAKLMDISLQKRFTQAKEQAFTDAISKTAPWKAGDVRSKRAFQQVIQAIRSGALDPSRNMASDIAALNGWTGFSADQYKNLLKNDAILADPKSGELQKAEAYKAIQDIISKSKLPIRARDVIGQYYDAQALSGIPTLTVNSFSPIAFAMRNAIVEAGSGTIKGDAKAIGRAATAFVDSIKSWANTTAFSFKNNVTVYSNVDYIVNDDNLLRLYRKGVDQFTKSKNAKERADGVKNMMVGMMDYVRRILNALDYGAIAALQNQNISKYAMAVMRRQKMNDKQANEMFGVMMKAKNDFYLQQTAIGTDKNKASILADEFYISSWKEALSKAGVEKTDIQQAMDAAINDALSSVGRNRQSLDAFKEEDTRLKDAGVSSMPALWLLESVANAAKRSDNQIIKLFSRVIYGFAIVPARVIRETAWFSPYGFVRFGYDAIAKKMGKTSPYAQSLGTDVQYSQRLNEAIAGTVALTALFALRAGSTDDPEDEDAFKIVFTGNGPRRKDDPQFYDSWYKAGNKPNTMSVSFGKGKFDLNMMRGFEAFTWPAMMLGALDDFEIRKKQKQQTKTPGQLEDAAIVAGFVFDAALRRGPYAFTTKSLFGTYGDIGVEGVAKGLTFPAKTLIPVLGTSLASNLSNFLNDPIDRRTLDGAVWSNIPFIGPAVAPKSLNAFGEPALSNDMASKMFKLGVPIVYDIPTDRESIKLHELVLKQGGGPSIPTRNQLAQRLDRQPTNKEYEMFVREYGTILTTSMKKNYDKLFDANPEFYSKAVERIGNRARDIAENKVRQAAKKP